MQRDVQPTPEKTFNREHRFLAQTEPDRDIFLSVRILFGRFKASITYGGVWAPSEVERANFSMVSP
jgi:hypothetical protein